VPLLLFGLRAIGGGDVKLLATIGALAGASRGLEIQLASYCVLTLYALVLLAHRGQVLGTLGRALRILIAPLLRRPAPAAETLLSLRLGPSIFVATAGTLLSAWVGGGP
jgi:prepilin peptidase CpaA